MSELLADLLITVLFGTQASFTHPGVILPAKESLGDFELKNIVRKSQRNKAEREVLGYSSRVWRSLTETLHSGNEQLLENKHHLLSKIADLASLGRNLLVAKEKAQDICAAEGFEAEIRKLIEICIEKASKPISPNLDKGHHEKEMKIKQAYKRVLITALQFLNNLVTSNETRKLHLWMHLFGSPTATWSDDDVASFDGLVSEDVDTNSESILAQGPSLKSAGKQPEKSAEQINSPEQLASLPVGVYSGFASLSTSFNYSYYNPGFLTDVPRILGPSEIEALPMIIQNGIAPLEGSDKDMQSVRCNIFLAQESGRALLRELLVFLGAWEVEERDFCYKMMQSVTEAVLLNGLVPFVYEAFKDDKDIITPAQCVFLKLLVSIYRSPLPTINNVDPPKPSKIIPSMTLIPLRLQSQSLTSSDHASPPSPTPATDATDEPSIPATQPQILDTSIAAYLIHIFRQDVLPNIRRIILQQGAIKSGELKREQFEWSLWDLDRVYEGLYQFMEMMVVFAEDEDSKKIMLEDVSEAVAGLRHITEEEEIEQLTVEGHVPEAVQGGGLLGELIGLLVDMDRIIPRYLQTKPMQPQTHADTQAAVHYPNPPPSDSITTTTPKQAPSTQATTSTNLVERPYDPPPQSPIPPLLCDPHSHYSRNPHSRSPSPTPSSTSSLDPDSTLTDPEEFTWPHMKKFCVLLLSNLCWKNNDVKDLVRLRGGLAAVLNQCMVDDDNPYIREYAILCIRNLLEGNARNQSVVGGMEKKVKEKEEGRLDEVDLSDGKGIEGIVDGVGPDNEER